MEPNKLALDVVNVKRKRNGLEVEHFRLDFTRLVEVGEQSGTNIKKLFLDIIDGCINCGKVLMQNLTNLMSLTNQCQSNS